MAGNFYTLRAPSCFWRVANRLHRRQSSAYCHGQVCRWSRADQVERREMNRQWAGGESIVALNPTSTILRRIADWTWGTARALELGRSSSRQGYFYVRVAFTNRRMSRIACFRRATGLHDTRSGRVTCFFINLKILYHIDYGAFWWQRKRLSACRHAIQIFRHEVGKDGEDVCFQ